MDRQTKLAFYRKTRNTIHLLAIQKIKLVL